MPNELSGQWIILKGICQNFLERSHISVSRQTEIKVWRAVGGSELAHTASLSMIKITGYSLTIRVIAYVIP